MIDALITSKTRLKILLKFFLNPQNKAYLRSLESDFHESTNGIRVELNRLEEANMLLSSMDGKKKVYSVNKQHPLFNEINSIVRKYVGLDVIMDKVLAKLGGLQAVFLLGDFAKGLSSETIELLMVGDINTQYADELITKAKSLLHKRVDYKVVNTEVEAQQIIAEHAYLLLWTAS